MYRDGPYHAGKLYTFSTSMLALPLGLRSQQEEFVSQLLALTT